MTTEELLSAVLDELRAVRALGEARAVAQGLCCGQCGAVAPPFLWRVARPIWSGGGYRWAERRAELESPDAGAELPEPMCRSCGVRAVVELAFNAIGPATVFSREVLVRVSAAIGSGL